MTLFMKVSDSQPNFPFSRGHTADSRIRESAFLRAGDADDD